VAQEKRPKEKNTESGKISRREFLKDAGLVAGVAAIGSVGVLTACTPKDVGETTTVTSTATVTAQVTKTVPVTVTEKPLPQVSTGASTVKFTVNKKPYEFQIESEETLRDVIRGQLGLTSMKDMCLGYGACGSCTVIMNGRPILSCLALAAECDGAVIETAEGLAEDNHPLIQAFVDNYSFQCGYCTPGIVCTAKALLDRNSKPTEDEIREALTGNLCRCGSYQSIIKAVKDAAGKL